MLRLAKILKKHGKQYIPDITKATLPEIFRGRPVIKHGITRNESNALVELCPTDAIWTDPVRIDLGKCVFCNECAFFLPEKVRFTNDYKIASNDRKNLIIQEGDNFPVQFDPGIIREEIQNYFGASLKLRQVSAGGDNSSELELNACGNVNFDMGRFGIEFTASPRHADGIVITGPITGNMAGALQECYEAIPEPKIIILVGVDAISGGIFSESPAVKREFLDNHKVDLYVPGNPLHPLTFINGILGLLRK